MPRSQKLTKAQTDNMRHTLAKRGGQILSRLSRHANGETDMKPSEIKAAQIVLAKILPDMQSTTYEDITPERQDPRTTQQQLNEYIARIDPVELARIQREHSDTDTLQ